MLAKGAEGVSAKTVQSNPCALIAVERGKHENLQPRQVQCAAVVYPKNDQYQVGTCLQYEPPGMFNFALRIASYFLFVKCALLEGDALGKCRPVIKEMGKCRHAEINWCTHLLY